MKKILFNFIFISILISSAADAQLLMTVDLIRHGDRTPIHDIPSLAVNWHQGPGELTALGVKQERALGVRLRKEYIHHFHLLPDLCQPGLLFVRATDRVRTQKSAEALLQGLYPVNKKGTCKRIPIVFLPRKADTLLSVSPDQYFFKRLQLYFFIRKNWAEFWHQHQQDLLRYSEMTQFNIDGFHPLIHLADNLLIRHVHRIPPPAGLTQLDINQLLQWREELMSKYFGLKAVYCNMGSEFLQTVTTLMRQAENHHAPLKYVLFSAHDSSIMAVMSMLGVSMKTVPPYASRLNFSLFEADGQHFIKIQLNDRPLFIPACNSDRCKRRDLAELRC